jgi:hypothetical protein
VVTQSVLNEAGRCDYVELHVLRAAGSCWQNQDGVWKGVSQGSGTGSVGANKQSAASRWAQSPLGMLEARSGIVSDKISQTTGL